VLLSSFSDPARWAEQQWSTAALGEARRPRRAVPLGAALASRPEASLPAQTGSGGGLKSASRLWNEPEVTQAALGEPPWQARRPPAEQADIVLFVQHTSDLDFTAHRQTTGLGWIGNTGACGFLLHRCLAVRPRAVPEILGWAAPRVWTRHEVKKGTGTRAVHAQRRKESEVWAEVVEAIGPAAPHPYWVSVSDRASDIFRSCGAPAPKPGLALVACGPEPSGLGRDWQENEVVAGLGAAAPGPNRNEPRSARSG
jgi:Transposase DNA-binding